MSNRLLIIIIFFSLSSKAQQVILLDSLKIPEPLTVSIDKLGNYYLVSKNGTIKKYNQDNKIKNDFSPQQVGKPLIIEAWNPLRLFAYYEGLQEYIFLDRFMTSANRFDLRAVTDYCGLATPSADNNIWLIDLAEFGLKKYNTIYKQVSINTPFDLLLNPSDYNITHIREYQNLVFISDAKSSILIFDNLGNYLRKLPYTNVDYFNFHQSEIYFLQNDKVIFVDIYSEKEHTYTLDGYYKFCLFDGTSLRLFDRKQMRIFKLSQ